jgi:cell division protein FtsZ
MQTNPFASELLPPLEGTQPPAGAPALTGPALAPGGASPAGGLPSPESRGAATSGSAAAAPPTPSAVRRLTMKLFGVGGAGGNALAHIVQSGLEGVECVAINTDAAALERCPVPHKLLLGSRLTRGLGAGGDPERGRAAAEEDLEKLRAWCVGADLVFVLAGLGGGTGTGASPILAELARQSGALVLGMVVLPFDWEGQRRQRQAQLGLAQLKGAADSVICLPNQKLFGLVADKTSVLEGFAIAHDLLARGIRGIWRLLTLPGLINVDFADVCAVTRDRHVECVLAMAEAQGESRAKDVAERLLHHPLLEEGRVLNDAATALVSLVGGPDMSLAEVNHVMEQISRQCEYAHIIVGASIEPSHTGRLAVTLLSSRRGAREKAAGAAAEPSAAELAPREPLLVEPGAENRLASRYVAPPPAITPENAGQLLQNLPPRARRKAIKLVQGQLPLEVISRGRFDKGEPTIRSGQDLDVPTYLRRNLVLN